MKRKVIFIKIKIPFRLVPPGMLKSITEEEEDQDIGAMLKCML